MCSCWDSFKRGQPGWRRALLDLAGTALIKIHKLSGSSPWCPCHGRASPGFQGSAERLGKPLPTRRVQHSSVCCALPSLLVEEIFIPRSTRELKWSRTSGREKGCTSSSSGIHIYPRPRFKIPEEFLDPTLVRSTCSLQATDCTLSLVHL
jgi:hypothetical protein